VRLIPLVDLQSQYRDIKADVAAAIERVLDSARLVLGPEGAAFEDEFAAFCRTGLTRAGLETYFAPRTGRAALNTCINQATPRTPNPQPLLIRNLTIQGRSASVDLRAEGQFLTFYFVKQGGRWLAVDQHGSAMPIQ